MADFKTLNGYAVKDNQARTDIANILEVQNTLKNNLSNPNLLINGNFKEVINQRSASNYSSSALAVYGIDRWCTIGSVTTTITPGEKIKVTNNSGSSDGYFLQKFEKKLDNDKRYTYAIKVLSLTGPVTPSLGNQNVTNTGEPLTIGNNIYTLPLYGIDYSQFVLTLTPGASIELEYIKLEEGLLATPGGFRLYDDELLICKRYYQRAEAYEYFGTLISMGSNAYRCTTGYTGFRVDPTVKVPSNTKMGLMNISDGTTGYTGNVTEVLAAKNGMMKITVSGTSVALGRTAIGTITTSLEFDAEIY